MSITAAPSSVSWVWSSRRRRAGGSSCRAAAADGKGPGQEKVYRADDVLLRTSDIENCKQYDECDVSIEMLGDEVDTSVGRDGGKDGGRKPFHVHFGAGRLGLGLVVGTIAASETPFAIVQRPKSTWKSITSQGCGSQIQLTVNGKPIAPDVTVINEDCDIEEYLKVGRAAIVVVGHRPTLLQLIRKATSFSCSLGSAMGIAMIPLLSELDQKPEEERPVLYACENDHDAVRKLGASASVFGKVTTIPCMVDRICTGRTIEEHFVDVEAEPGFSGSLVLLDPPADPSLVPFAGDNVLVPTDKQEAKYFYKRKFSMVNGMHTVLGFMTLREKTPGARECTEQELLTYATAREELRTEMRIWCAIRCLALIDEFGLDLLKKVHHKETEEDVFDTLLSYGQQALDRFSSITDTTTRVLGGGLGNRLATRLRPVVEFLKTTPQTGTGSAGERFLKYAKIDEKFALKAMQDLRYGSVIFCHKERVIAYEATKAKAAAFEKEQQERAAATTVATAAAGAASNTAAAVPTEETSAAAGETAAGAASQSASATSRHGETAAA